MFQVVGNDLLFDGVKVGQLLDAPAIAATLRGRVEEELEAINEPTEAVCKFCGDEITEDEMDDDTPPADGSDLA